MKNILIFLAFLFCVVTSEANAQATVSTYSNVSSPSVAATNRQQLFPTRTIVSGTIDTLTKNDSVVFWNSSTNSAKTESVPACGSTMANTTFTLYDESNNAATYNIVLTPTSGTINLASSYTFATSGATLILSCDVSTLNWNINSGSGGGGGTPGGTSGQIQYNNSGAFGGLGVGTGLEISGSDLIATGSSAATVVYLGTSVTTPLPSASASDTTTGLYTSGASSVDFGISGIHEAQVNASGINVVPANDGYFIGGLNALSFPTEATTLGGTIAIGPSALANVSSTANSNIAIGSGALRNDTTGVQNIAIGQNALATIGTTGEDVAIGYDALMNYQDVTSGVNQQVAVGWQACKNLTTGVQSVCVGADALTNDTTGGENTAVGGFSLATIGTGSFNTATGVSAARQAGCISDLGSSGNTADGTDAGRDLGCNSQNNTMLGVSAMKFANTNLLTGGGMVGGYNTAVGASTMQYYVGTDVFGGNVAVGALALADPQNSTTGGTFNNTSAVGFAALENVTGGNSNTAMGYKVGFTLTTGSSNTILGNLVGSNTLATGSSNILIGVADSGSGGADTATSSTSNWLDIGGLIQGNLLTGSRGVAIGTNVITSGVSFDMGSLTQPLLLPPNTAGTGVEGAIRYNSTVPAVQVYQNGAWATLGAGAATSGTFIASDCLESQSTSSLLTIVDTGAPCGGTFTLNLGASAAANSPQVTGDASTGLNSAAASTVSVGIKGVETVTIGTNYISLPPQTAAYEINGINALSMPSTDSVAGASIAIGSSALLNLPNLASTAFADMGIGQQALGGVLTTAAIKDTAVGYQALKTNTSGALNTAVGYDACGGVTSGGQNICVGTNAGLGLTSNTGNIAIGVNTLAVVAGNSNSALGTGALFATTGGVNSAFGNNSGAQISSGSDNTAVGGSALAGVSGTKTTGSANTAVGWEAGFLVQGAAANNTILGAAVASTTLTTGTGNIVIGTNNGVDTQSSSSANTLNIGNIIYGTGLSTSGTTSTGSVAVGTPTSLSGAVLTLAGHLGFSTASIPTITSCGSGTLVTGSTDNKGQITGITAATGCTITFGTPLPAAPACSFSTSTGIAAGGIPTTAAVTTTMAVFTGTLGYVCF